MRDPEKSLEIEGNRREHSRLQVRSSGASLRSRERRVEGRFLGYHAVEGSIPTRVRIGSVMIPKWKRSKRRWPQQRSERGLSAFKPQAVDFEFERSFAWQFIYLRAAAIGCGDRLPPVGQAPLPSGARKLASSGARVAGRFADRQ